MYLNILSILSPNFLSASTALIDLDSEDDVIRVAQVKVPDSSSTVPKTLDLTKFREVYTFTQIPEKPTSIWGDYSADAIIN